MRRTSFSSWGAHRHARWRRGRFLFGDAIRSLDAKNRLAGRLVPSLAALGVTAGIAVAIMARAEFAFLRFGTMSLAFFVSTIVVLAFSVALAWILCAPGRSVRLGTALALRGVGSFAVVPIHMFLIVLVSHAASLPMSGRVYVIAILPFVVLNYWLAARADREARRVGVRTPVGSPAWNATAATLAAAAFVVTILPLGFVRIAGATIAQLLVAVLLTVRPQRTAVV